MSPSGYDRFHPVVAIANESKSVSDRDVRRVLPALQKQIDRDFTPAWGLPGELVFGKGSSRSMRVILRDVSDEAGDLGYHFLNGYPVTYVFVKDDIEQYGEFTSTLSHELLEMLADPGVNLYADGFVHTKGGKKQKAFIPYEVCDAVQENLYSIGGVRLSDFLLPEWFEPEHKGTSLKMDFLGVVRRPFALARGGYTDAVVGQSLRTYYGREARRKKVRHRKLARERVRGELAGS